MTQKLATSLVALSAALTTPALADVTAGDVFANQQAFYSSVGGTLSGTLSADGTISPEMNFILPQGVASLQIKVGEITMTDNSDGSVTISYPSPLSVTLAGGADGEGSFTAELVLTHGGYTSVATGDPGDVAYETNAQDVNIEVTNLTVEGGTTEDVSMTGFLDMESWTTVSRVTEGNMISYTSTTTTGESNAEFAVDVDNVSSTTTQTTLPLQTAIAATLPVGGANLMNLSQALRDGLSIAIESSGAGSSSTSETLLNGDVMNSQDTTTGPQTFAAVFDENGLLVDANASDIATTMNDPLVFPGDLDFAIAGVSMNYDVPLNASEDAQDFRVATSLSGIVLGDVIWNMMDPSAQLPRDPADISFDITGVGTTGLDLLDFMALSQMAGPPPVQVDEVTIENLRIAAVGAEATAEGTMTFDWTDFSTIPGVPRPEGAITVNLNGANQLMDTLVAMGLIPEQDLMMPRMMMGMFATPVGDDMLESVIEVNEQGHVLANGQRLQ